MCDQWVYDPRLGHQQGSRQEPYVPQPRRVHCPNVARYEAYCATYAYGKQMPLSSERRRVCFSCARVLGSMQQMPLRSRLRPSPGVDPANGVKLPETYILVTIRPLSQKAREGM